MRSAIAIAQSALKTEDVPVGALIVDSENNVISTGFNEREAHQDPTAHAEIVAIRRAAQKLESCRLAVLCQLDLHALQLLCSRCCQRSLRWRVLARAASVSCWHT